MLPQPRKTIVKLTFLDEALGMSTPDPEVYSQYIASNAPNAKTMKDEVAAVVRATGADTSVPDDMNPEDIDKILENKSTIFPVDKDGNKIFWAYQLVGWLKDSCGYIRMIPGTDCSKLKAYKKAIEGLIHINGEDDSDPMKAKEVIIHYPDTGDTSRNCQRTLRKSGPMGPSTALASSQTMPKGSYIIFTAETFTKAGYDILMECLEYGIYHGLGQWRTSGKGIFSYEILADTKGTTPEVEDAPKKKATKKVAAE